MSRRMDNPKIPAAKQVSWLLFSLVSDFWVAWFLMLGMGALHIHWGYWHAWWVGFTFGTVFATSMYCVARYLEYIAERMT